MIGATSGGSWAWLGGSSGYHWSLLLGRKGHVSTFLCGGRHVHHIYTIRSAPTEEGE